MNQHAMFSSCTLHLRGISTKPTLVLKLKDVVLGMSLELHHLSSRIPTLVTLIRSLVLVDPQVGQEVSLLTELVTADFAPEHSLRTATGMVMVVCGYSTGV